MLARVRPREVLRWILGILGSVAVGVALLGAAIIYSPRFVERGSATPDAYLNAVTATRTTLVQPLLGAAVFIGAAVGFLNLQHSKRAHVETLTLTQRGQVTDRFTKAIEQLGSEKLDVRVGGVYALEQIAHDSPDLHWPIVEVLTAFVRDHARRPASGSIWGEKSGYKPTAEILAIMRVLRRRNASLDLDRINLAHTDLREVDLHGANLSGADLRGVSLVNAWLAGANFSDTRLWYADFRAADLDAAKFVRADVRHVRMNDGTSLSRTDFTGAYIVELYLDGASLDEAVTTDAHISGVQHGPPADSAS